MPLKNPDPFSDRAASLDASVNPFVAKLRDGAASGSLPVSYGSGLRDMKGRWREHLAGTTGNFGAHSKLVLEIGCHKGLTLLALARSFPDVGFIGMDITFKRVVTTAERALAEGLSNVTLVLANAMALSQVFAPGELDGCVIFFPDPWIKKKRQLKNRLVHANFALQLRELLSEQGFCWFKTDQLEYFAAAADAFSAAGLTPGRSSLIGEQTFTSTFEQRFQERGLPTYDGTWLKSQG